MNIWALGKNNLEFYVIKYLINCKDKKLLLNKLALSNI